MLKILILSFILLLPLTSFAAEGGSGHGGNGGGSLPQRI
jgi:hypothetical protein